MTPITIEFGDVIFCGAEGSITTINGVNVKISPDGHHSVDFSEEANEAADQLLNDKLDEIKEELTREIAGMLLWNNCDGSELEQSYSGNGLLGISAQVDTVLSIVNEGVGEYCPLLGEDEFEGVFIEEVSVSDSPIATYSDVALPASARKFSVDVDGNTPSYAVAGSGVPTTEDVQGRFAVVSSGYVFDGGVRIVRTENQYYRGAMYDVATKAGSLSIARVSLRPGNTAKIRSFS